MVGVVSLDQAIRMAEDAELDLVCSSFSCHILYF